MVIYCNFNKEINKFIDALYRCNDNAYYTRLHDIIMIPFKLLIVMV